LGDITQFVGAVDRGLAQAGNVFMPVFGDLDKAFGKALHVESVKRNCVVLLKHNFAPYTK